jgi:hypothetical protein
MGIAYNTSIVYDSLFLHFDAANTRSYPGSGTSWVDLSRSNTSASITGITLVGSGATSALSFNGSFTAPISNVTGLQYSTGPRTVLAWVYPTALSGWNQIFGFGTATSNHASGLAIDPSGRWATYQHNVAGYYGSNVTTNVWSNIVVTQSTSGWKLYLNGALDNSGANQITANQGSAYIGGSFQDTEKFTGRIAQVLFYNKELTPAEIKQIYHATKKRYGL